MNSITVEVNNWYETLKEKRLEENDRSTAIWTKYKSDLLITKSLLALLPKKISHQVMVPIGPKALIPGKIVHTNEFLVNLGEAWFAKKCAFQTEELCDRRITNCDEMLKKLEKEKELITAKTNLPAEKEAFGSSERPEIIEYVTEEENEAWIKEHKIREREYRKKLAELRNSEKKTIESEDDLWKRLDELELQEELEDELNRLNEHCRYSSSDDDEEKEGEIDNNINIDCDILKINSESYAAVSDKTLIEEGNKNTNDSDESKTNCNSEVKKRKVSFACDLELSDDEPLHLYIKHSNVESIKISQNSEIISPKDIYNNFIKSSGIVQTPVLKSVNNPNRELEIKKLNELKEYNSSESEDGYDENEETIKCERSYSSVILNDVIERSPLENLGLQHIKDKGKKVSKFKASRAK